MKKVVIFDIDGTLANCEHRRHHVRNGNKNWQAFLSAANLDPVIEPIAELSRIVARGMDIICCTGRGEEYRTLTETWLKNNNIPFSKLYMRPADDMRADHVVKKEMLGHLYNDEYEPLLVVDDRQSVVQMWRQNGLICLQCSDWDETQSQAGVKFDILVGPSGSGKSTYATTNYSSSQIISTDQIRQDLCGDFKDQSRNDDVFAAAHSLIKTRLCHGLSVVFDATNIKRKDRMTAALLGLPNATVTYIIINRSMGEKRRDGDWRNNLPVDLLERHEQTFNSQLKDILNGDGLNVKVVDLRKP